MNAEQSALVLDRVEIFFCGGGRWTKGTYHRRDDSRCLLGAVRFVRNELGNSRDLAPDYLARAIGIEPGSGETWMHRWAAVMHFNDARSRTYPEIAAVIRKARALAEADMHGEEGDSHALGSRPICRHAGGTGG
jgi:hypothetical protein